MTSADCTGIVPRSSTLTERDTAGPTLRVYMDRLAIAERDLGIAHSNAAYWHKQRDDVLANYQRVLMTCAETTLALDRVREANAELAEEVNEMRETVAAHEATIAALRAGILAEATHDL